MSLRNKLSSMAMLPNVGINHNMNMILLDSIYRGFIHCTKSPSNHAPMLTGNETSPQDDSPTRDDLIIPMPAIPPQSRLRSNRLKTAQEKVPNTSSTSASRVDEFGRIPYHEDFLELLFLALRIKRLSLDVPGVSEIIKMRGHVKNRTSQNIIKKGQLPMTDQAIKISFKILRTALHGHELGMGKKHASLWQTDILQEWMLKNCKNPTAEQIKELEEETCLSSSEIVKWTTLVLNKMRSRNAQGHASAAIKKAKKRPDTIKTKLSNATAASESKPAIAMDNPPVSAASGKENNNQWTKKPMQLSRMVLRSNSVAPMKVNSPASSRTC